MRSLLLAVTLPFASFAATTAQAQPAATATPDAAPATTVTPAASAVAVDESPAPPIKPAPKVLPGWSALWSQLPKSSADLRIALAEIERAEAATRIAVGALLPTLNGSVSLSYSPKKSGGAGRPFTLTGPQIQSSLNASITLVNVRAIHQVGTQEVLEDVAALSAQEVRRKLGLSLARGVASIAAAQRLAQGNRTSLDLALDRLALTRKRLGAGLGDVRDLVRAQQDVATARAQIAPADEALLQAQEGLATLLGVPGALGFAADFEGLEKEVRSFCGTGDGTARVDLLIAKKQIEVAERNVDDITLKFLPTLTASASANAYGPAFSGPFNTGWSLGLTLSIPLYDGGVRYAEKKDRIAQVTIAKAKAVQVDLAMTLEKVQTERAIEVAIAAQKAAKEARDLAAEAERLAKVAYANGIGTNFDLIDTGRTLRQAETTLVLRDLDVARARLALPFVEGTCTGTQS